MLKPNLDFLRALAVLLVLTAHIAGYTIRTNPVSFAMGQLGVMLFFVHTSLVLMQSLERQQLDGAALLRAFYLQRRAIMNRDDAGMESPALQRALESLSRAGYRVEGLLSCYRAREDTGLILRSVGALGLTSAPLYRGPDCDLYGMSR